MSHRAERRQIVIQAMKEDQKDASEEALIAIAEEFFEIGECLTKISGNMAALVDSQKQMSLALAQLVESVKRIDDRQKSLGRIVGP